MLIDTHCHLDFDQFNSDRVSVIKRAEEAGVKCVINVGSSLEGSRKSVELASEYDSIFASVGVHPHHAEEVSEDTLFARKAFLKSLEINPENETAKKHMRE